MKYGVAHARVPPPVHKQSVMVDVAQPLQVSLQAELELVM